MGVAIHHTGRLAVDIQKRVCGFHVARQTGASVHWRISLDQGRSSAAGPTIGFIHGAVGRIAVRVITLTIAEDRIPVAGGCIDRATSIGRAVGEVLLHVCVVVEPSSGTHTRVFSADSRQRAMRATLRSHAGGRATRVHELAFSTHTVVRHATESTRAPATWLVDATSSTNLHSTQYGRGATESIAFVTDTTVGDWIVCAIAGCRGTEINLAGEAIVEGLTHTRARVTASAVVARDILTAVGGVVVRLVGDGAGTRRHCGVRVGADRLRTVGAVPRICTITEPRGNVTNAAILTGVDACHDLRGVFIRRKALAHGSAERGIVDAVGWIADQIFTVRGGRIRKIDAPHHTAVTNTGLGIPGAAVGAWVVVDIAFGTTPKLVTGTDLGRVGDGPWFPRLCIRVHCASLITTARLVTVRYTCAVRSVGPGHDLIGVAGAVGEHIAVTRRRRPLSVQGAVRAASRGIGGLAVHTTSSALHSIPRGTIIGASLEGTGGRFVTRRRGTGGPFVGRVAWTRAGAVRKGARIGPSACRCVATEISGAAV